MSYLSHLIEQYGLLLVFFNVLLEQIGLPLPAYTTLVIAAVLLGNGDYHQLQCERLTTGRYGNR